ncbi:MAG: molybdopterin-dependent oxidoreductase [Gammaproteobacteria bacterium]|nr:molybdopterin-dependent oxidoreductase [Gammaproteobacteria bacterium]
MKRRDFIKLSSFAGAGAAVAPALLSGCSEQQAPGAGDVTATPTICDICFWRCAGQVYKEDGQPWKVVGNPQDLHSGGRLCTRGSGGLGSYMDPDRLKTPLKRTTKNGRQTFQAISWDEALDYIAERMKKVATEHGADRIALFSHGSGGAHFKHLMKAFGSDTYAAPSFAQCRGPRDVGFQLTYGEGVGNPDRTDMEHSRCIVLIGSHLGENLHNSQVQTFTQALAKGATIITVDPRFSVAASKSRYWLPIKPGTDIALLLAWMHVLIGEELYDRDYIQRHAHGFEELVRHVNPFTPEWAYLETGLQPELIRETAREMARQAPASLVHPGRHVTWYGDDTQRSRAIAIVNALLGSWGRRGGFYIQDRVRLPKYPTPKYPQAASNWKAANRGKYPFATMGVANAVIDASVGPDSHYKAWFVYGTNLPLTIPNIRAKLEQAAENLDFIVAIDILPADITGYADLVLPECTYLERYDNLRNSPERQPSLALRMPAFEPRFQSKPAWWISKQIGQRLGLDEYFPWNNLTEVLDWQLKQVGSSLEEMQRVGVKSFPRSTAMYFTEGADRKFRTPTGKIELYSTRLAEQGFDPLPRYTPPEQAPANHYRLIYGRIPAHTFGRTINNPQLFALSPENNVWINPLTASDWHIKNGEYVRLKNQDGVVSNRIRVRVTERIRPDSVFMAHGFGHTDRRLRLAYNRGADDASLITNVKIDPIMGGTGMRANFVTFVKDTT